MRRPPFSAEEIARRGQEIYEQRIRSQVDTPTNRGRVVVLDIQTGDYEIDADHLTAYKRARARMPDALLFATRVGFPALAKMGGWPSAVHSS